MARYRLLMVLVLAVITVPGTVLAGGWALTSFDELPTSFEAGETYELSYTILQHGQTPVDVGSSSVFITDSAGDVTEFEAIRNGSVGHYSVAVTFPDSGTFSWQVTQGGFGAHDLGSVDVAAGIATMTAAGESNLLPIAFALVIGLLVLQVVALVRKRPRSV